MGQSQQAHPSLALEVGLLRPLPPSYLVFLKPFYLYLTLLSSVWCCAIPTVITPYIIAVNPGPFLAHGFRRLISVLYQFGYFGGSCETLRPHL